MRRFALGALLGAGLMYLFLHQSAEWETWATGRIEGVGSDYRHDAMKKSADEVLR